MLLEVSIKNFAIIEQVSLNFENGMTILSGETGAGKSIIIDAMNLMLGRVRRQMLSDTGPPRLRLKGFFPLKIAELLSRFYLNKGLKWLTNSLSVVKSYKMDVRSAVSMDKWSIYLS